MACPKRRLDDQDPDYPEDSVSDTKRQRLAMQHGRAESCERVRRIVRSQFGGELRSREAQLLDCQERLHEATQALHLLRYLAVAAYYSSQNSQEQPRMHPAVKKLVGKNAGQAIKLEVPLPEQCQVVLHPGEQSGNHVIKEEVVVTTVTKQPRYIAHKEKENPFSSSPPRAAALKVKKRLVVGNISKFLHADMRDDVATHKWMVYVRGPPQCPDISGLVERVRFFLHASYQPHDVVEVTSAPFHLSRRGWGEFPVRVQIHFRCAENRPLDVIHQLRLDHTYTGLQTLGAETVVDVWLFEQPGSENTDTSAQNSLSTVTSETREQSGITLSIPKQPQPVQTSSRSLLKNSNVMKTNPLNVSDAFKTAGHQIRSKICEASVENITISHSSLSANNQESSGIDVSSIKIEPDLVETPVVPQAVNEKIVVKSELRAYSNNSQVNGSVSRNLQPVLQQPLQHFSIKLTSPSNKVAASSTSVLNGGERKSSSPSKSDGVMRHHDYARLTPRPNSVEIIKKSMSTEKANNPIIITSKPSQIKESLLKSNTINQIHNISELSGQKLIHLKPVSHTDVSKMNSNPKKMIQIINSSSILKSNATITSNVNNGLKNTSELNGTKFMLASSSVNNSSKRVIYITMDKNGQFPKVCAGPSSVVLPPLPPLIMIKRGPSVPAKSPGPGTQSLLLSKQARPPEVPTLQVIRPLTEMERMEKLSRQYEQQLKALEVRQVEEASLAMSLLLRALPLVGEKDMAYRRLHPYLAPSQETFLSWPHGKQKAAEGSRARLVRQLLVAQGFAARPMWDIARWARHHGFTPLLPALTSEGDSDQLSYYQADQDGGEQPSSYSEAREVFSWLECQSSTVKDATDAIIDVEGLTDERAPSPAEVKAELQDASDPACAAEVAAVRRLASQIGVQLNSEEIAPGVAFPAAETTLLEAGRLLVEDLLRRALATAWGRSEGPPASLEMSDVRAALLGRPEFDLFSNHGLGAEPDLSLNQSRDSFS